MMETPFLEVAIERLMQHIEKVRELFGIVEAKEMGQGQDHDDFKGDGIGFSELVLKDDEKPGKVCVPHGMPSDDEPFAFSSRVIPKAPRIKDAEKLRNYQIK
jgi:hypothetical protein